MKIFEVEFCDGRKQIVFAETRLQIWNNYHGVYRVYRVEII